MKKAIACLLALPLALAACGEPSTPATDPAASGSPAASRL